jgi:hypothetical protein
MESQDMDRVPMLVAEWERAKAGTPEKDEKLTVDPDAFRRFVLDSYGLRASRAPPRPDRRLLAIGERHAPKQRLF